MVTGRLLKLDYNMYRVFCRFEGIILLLEYCTYISNYSRVQYQLYYL